MFLSSHEIAQSREHALQHLSAWSSAQLDAGQRWSDLLSSTGRDFLGACRKHLDQYGDGKSEQANQYPAAFWIDNSARHTRLFDAACEIAADTHKRLVETAEGQMRVIDEMLIHTINRTKNSSPWEAEPALLALRVGVQSAEKTLHEVNQAAISTVDAAENEIHSITQEILEQPAASKPRSRSRSTKKAA